MIELSRVPHISAHLAAAVLHFHGIENVIVSPGSRNAPLIQALHESGHFILRAIVDERSAAFFALGIAEATGKPVALVCTSGSAMLNYAPALSEAYYRRIPLIAISADRPTYTINRNESQTIRQPNALENIVKFSADIPDGIDSGIFRRHCKTTLDEAISYAMSAPRGPVHINIRFARPLTCKPTEIALPDFRGTLSFAVSDELSKRDVSYLAERAKGKRILLVAGSLLPQGNLSESVARFAAHPNHVCVAEHGANLHGDVILHGTELLGTLLNSNNGKELTPDILITIGAPLISSGLKQWLSSLKDTEHWSIGNYPVWPDTFGRLTVNIKVEPEHILPLLSGNFNEISLSGHCYHDDWLQVEKDGRSLFERREHEIKWSDFQAAITILRGLKEDSNLFISNGTSIRYAEFTPDMNVAEVFANRGVSGIDGTTSTAAGIAVASGRDTFLLTGDMSLRYDIGTLFSPHIPANMKIAVINNQGGGIFRGISTTSGLECLEEAFTVEADCRMNLKGICMSSGWEYFRVSSMEELSDSLPLFITVNKKALLEIVTPPQESANQFRNIYKPL